MSIGLERADWRCSVERGSTGRLSNSAVNHVKSYTTICLTHSISLLWRGPLDKSHKDSCVCVRSAERRGGGIAHLPQGSVCVITGFAMGVDTSVVVINGFWAVSRPGPQWLYYIYTLSAYS